MRACHLDWKREIRRYQHGSKVRARQFAFELTPHPRLICRIANHETFLFPTDSFENGFKRFLPIAIFALQLLFEVDLWEHRVDLSLRAAQVDGLESRYQFRIVLAASGDEIGLAGQVGGSVKRHQKDMLKVACSGTEWVALIVMRVAGENNSFAPLRWCPRGIEFNNLKLSQRDSHHRWLW